MKLRQLLRLSNLLHSHKFILFNHPDLGLSSHLVVSISTGSFMGFVLLRVQSVQEALTIPKSGSTFGMHEVPGWGVLVQQARRDAIGVQWFRSSPEASGLQFPSHGCLGGDGKPRSGSTLYGIREIDD